MIMEIMDFLTYYEVLSDVLDPYLDRHRYQRTASHIVYTERDIRRSYYFPNSKLSLNYYPRSDILYHMEPDDYDRVTSLSTFLSMSAGLFINLVYLDISYSTSSYIPQLTQLRTLNCSYTKVQQLPESLVNLETLIACESWIVELPPTYVNLRHLDIYSTFIFELPEEYTRLERLCCSYTLVFELPRTYTRLSYLDHSFSIVNEIPETLVNLRTVKS